MSIFLALKPIVDMLYDYQFLDYGMVIFAITLIIFKFVKDKWYQDFFGRLCIADYIVVVLGILYFLSFLRYPTAKNQFFKTESAFLLYFLGRLYSDYFAKEKEPWEKFIIPYSAYAILYANFFYRLYSFVMVKKTGIDTIVEYWGLQNGGAFYYYKTDLALGVITSVALIYIFSEGKKWAILKWVSILPVSIFIVFSCKARIGQVILLIEYLIIATFELRKMLARKNIDSEKNNSKNNSKNNNLKDGKLNGTINFIIILAFLTLTGVFVFAEVSPLFANDYSVFEQSITPENALKIESLFHARQVIWWDTVHYIREQSFLTHLLGVDLGTEAEHNAKHWRLHSQYFKIFYSIGYLGCYLFLTYVWQWAKATIQNKNAKIIYFNLAFGIMFLAMCISAETLESTQMSWLPFLFAGMAMPIKDRGQS